MTLQIREEARLDLEAAARWYASQAPGLGRQFLSEVRDVFRRIEANPESYPALHRGTRRALIRRFPYGVIYFPLPDRGNVSILAMLHCGRDPRLWLRRATP